MNKLATQTLKFYLQNDLDNFASHYAKLNEEEKARLTLPMADCLLRKEFFSNAETLFKENLKTRYSPLAHLKYIECLLKQRNVDKGIVECKSLIRYAAFNFNSNYYYTAILHLGSFYRLQNKSEEVKRVVTVCPGDILPDAKNELSIYLLSQGNKEYDNSKLDILRHYSHRLLEEFVNSKSSEEDMLTRSVDLSSSLSCKQQRVRSIELVFRRSNYPLIKRIDPFLGGTRNYVNISQSRLKQLSEAKRVENEEFIPSFILSSKNKKRFKYLTHIHIAKCAGTTFGHTLAKMADFLHSETTKCRMKSTKYVNYLSHGDLIDKDHIDAIANTILSNQIQDTL